jgi:hypothetical protein
MGGAGARPAAAPETAAPAATAPGQNAPAAPPRAAAEPEVQELRRRVEQLADLVSKLSSEDKSQRAKRKPRRG